jgi:hypothetical protein
MPRYGRVQDRRFESMDGPAHVLEGGGTNGRATIKGLPVRSEVSTSGLRRDGQATGVMAEPVAVLLRDAVSIDTAVRLTGVDRATLQTAAAKGYLPSLKLGGATAPYIVRIRDVIAYLHTIASLKLQRDDFKPGRAFVGFQPWLVERIRRSYPDGAQAQGTPFAGEVVSHNRGGRPRTKPLEEEKPTDEKIVAQAPDHAPTKPKPRRRRRRRKATTAPRKPSLKERMRLPKWHPLWVRPGTEPEK